MNLLANLLKSVLLHFFIASNTASMAQTTYFISPTGDNANSGTKNSPWKTLTYALTKVSAGDTIYLQPGTYNEKVKIGKSGTGTHDLVITGDSINRPLLDGSGLKPTDREGMITISGQDHIKIAHLEIANFHSSTQNTPVGIYAEGNCDGITIEHCLIHDIVQTNTNDGAHGIGIFGTDAASGITNLKILNNELHNLQTMWSESLVLNGNVHGFLVEGNSVHDCNNIAYDFIGYEKECGNCSGTSGPGTDRARNGVVKNNIAYNIDSKDNPVYNNERSADGFYVDGGSNILFEQNLAHDCNLGFELASEHYGKTTDSITIRNCIAYYNNVCGISTGGYSKGTGAGGGSATHCMILNNTFYQNHNTNRSSDDWGAEILLQNRNISNTYKNNIVFADPDYPRTLISGSKNSGNVFGYNLYFGSTQGTTNGAVITSDPLFTNAGAFDFRLTAASPAIDAGETLAAVSGSKDYAGNARVSGNSIDIGAYEFQSVVTNIKTANSDNAWLIFPNPLNRDWSKTITIRSATHLTSWNIYNVRGERIFSGTPTISAMETKIDLAEIDPGLYFIELVSNGQVTLKEVMIK